jgi:hypothetical protein
MWSAKSNIKITNREVLNMRAESTSIDAGKYNLSVSEVQNPREKIEGSAPT